MLKQLLATIKAKIRAYRLKRNSLRPRLLPVGLTEFNEFCDDILELSGDYADRDSMIYAIASNIVSMKHDIHAVPMDYFVRVLRKAAANQVASYEFQRIKVEHDKKMAEEQARQKLAEATAKSNAVANVPEKV